MKRPDLNPKQRRFVAEYLKDQNATQAAIRAGYSKKTAYSIGQENLKKPEISNAVEKLLRAYEVTAGRVVAELGRLAFSDIRDLFNAEGSLKPMREWTENVARAVASVEVEELFAGVGRARKQIGVTRKVRFWSKNHALETLARHFKLLTDRVEVVDATNYAAILKARRQKVSKPHA